MKKNMKKTLAAVLVVMALLAMPISASAATEQSTNAEVTFTSEGSAGLELLSAPSLNFGSNALALAETTYDAAATPTKVQVYNGISLTGWTVKAKLSNFTTSGAVSLHGAKIDLLPTVQAGSGQTENLPTIPASISMISGDTDASTIMSADANKGMGLWNAIFEDETKATLTVPQYAATIGSHEATMSWTLENTP